MSESFPRVSAERPEEGKGRIERLLERRHQVAHAAMRIERLFSGPDEPKETDEELIAREAPYLPEKVRDRFAQCLATYREQRAESRRAERLLKDHMVLEERLSSDVKSPYEFGVYIFRKEVGEPPRAHVELKQKEGYFLMEFEDRGDFDRFNVKLGTSLPRSQSSGGMYHGAAAVKLLSGPTVPLLLIRLGYHASVPDSVIAHERQHFINHAVFHLFDGVEPVPAAGRWRERDATQQVKDEVLAFLREGRSGMQMERSLKDDTLYGRLFSVPGAKTETLRHAMADISEAVDAWRKILGASDGADALLVYQLIDVPLTAMASRVRRLTEFYRRRRDARVRKFGVPSFGIHLFGGSIRFAKRLRPMAEEAGRKEEAYRDEDDRLSSSILAADVKGTSEADVSSLSQGTQEAKDAYERALKPLLRHGHLPPFEEVRVAPALASGKERRLVERVCDAVLQRLTDLDEKDWESFFRSLDAGKGNAALDALKHRLAVDVQAMTKQPTDITARLSDWGDDSAIRFRIILPATATRPEITFRDFLVRPPSVPAPGAASRPRHAA